MRPRMTVAVTSVLISVMPVFAWAAWQTADPSGSTVAVQPSLTMCVTAGKQTAPCDPSNPLSVSPPAGNTSDTGVTATVGTTDTIMRNADAARHVVEFQVVTAGACVAVRYGAAANLTDGSSRLLGTGCPQPAPIAWTDDAGAIDLRAIHAISLSTAAILRIWVR